MRRFVPTLTLLLCSLLLSGQETQQMMDMSGTICNSKCVSQSGDHSVCDVNCNDKSGDAVFVDDTGKVTKVANPDKVKGFMGKHVKAKCKMMKETNEMWFESLSIHG